MNISCRATTEPLTVQHQWLSNPNNHLALPFDYSMDAVYFQLGTLWQAGWTAGSEAPVPDGPVLGWGHAMPPARVS